MLINLNVQKLLLGRAMLFKTDTPEVTPLDTVNELTGLAIATVFTHDNVTAEDFEFIT